MTETLNFSAALPTPQQPARVSDVASWNACPVLGKESPSSDSALESGIQTVPHFLGPQEGNMRAPCSQQAQQEDL